jgi:hypothetical protein
MTQNNISKYLITIITSFCFCALTFKNCQAQTEDNFVTFSESGKECLKFTCKIISQAELDNPIEVMLYLNNNIIDHRTLDGSNKIKFILKRDACYIIQISTPFYITRYVMVNTNMPEKIKQKGIYKHDMQIELSKEPQIYYTSEVNSEVLDKPVTIIKYKAQDDKFDCDLKYTAEVRRDLRKFKKSINKLVIDQSKN